METGLEIVQPVTQSVIILLFRICCSEKCHLLLTEWHPFLDPNSCNVKKIEKTKNRAGCLLLKNLGNAQTH